ncbi:WD repeat-containing protein 13-like [Dysidea avara]|uniref:WD repeat-containing protein 13-like n=1 Tax=Dysidea avara TaxID=196820 RepID=UPI00332A495C
MEAAQQILALDARYNSYRMSAFPQHRTLYIRRRNQLLRENAKLEADPTIRKKYYKLRAHILSQKYGALERRNQSGAGSRMSTQSMDSMLVMDSSPHFVPAQKRHHSTLDPIRGVVPTRSAEASRAMVGSVSLVEHYEFSSMEHILDQHKQAVTAIRFSNDDKACLACSSQDGNLSVFDLSTDPPSISCALKGHTQPVNDFDWSISNDFIVSVSSDGMCRLWDSISGKCLRVIRDTSGVQTYCCRFHPLNNNFVTTGNSKGQVKVFNVSTGMAVKGGNTKTAGSTLSLAFDSSGTVLWAGDGKGSIFAFYFDQVSGKLQRSKRFVVSPGYGISCITWRSWISREARDPSLLVNSTDGSLRLYRILPDGNIFLKRKFAVPHDGYNIRSAFCPLMSFLQGACVVTGSSDMSVYFFDVETGSIVNKLQGHSSPVLALCWAYDESLLASCALDGTIIVWKRNNTKS